MNFLQCPVCEAKFLELTDQGVCIELHNECVSCRFEDAVQAYFKECDPNGEHTGDIPWARERLNDFVKANAELQLIAKTRAEREKATGKRVFDCPKCGNGPNKRNCNFCHGRGFVVGRPAPGT